MFAALSAALLLAACASAPRGAPSAAGPRSAPAATQPDGRTNAASDVATPSTEELPFFREQAREAAGRRDFRLGHVYMAAVTLHPEAVALDWMMRAELAMDSGKFRDAAAAFSTVVSRWPQQAQQVDWGRVIQQSAFQIRNSDVHRADYMAFVEALYAGNFRLAYGLQPEALWKDLVVDALERGDVPRAREVLSRIDSVEVLLEMRVDRRFDSLVAVEPERFDIDSALLRATTRGETFVALHPRALDAFVQYAYALFDAGRHAEVLAMCDAILARVDGAAGKDPPYDDLDDALNWVYNHKAGALRALGRWDEALAVMEAARSLPEHGRGNFSQTINLASHYIDSGRFAEALAAVERLECDDSVSPYGCMQLHAALHAAHRRLGNEGQADQAFAYLSANRRDAEDTWITAMLETGDLDAAARRLIVQLEDPHQRGAALLGVQTYRPLPATPVMQEREAQRQRLFARADVAAAIERVGRRGSVAVYRTPN
jgi:tetratricopeptide (TPR) repeat protein